jgi:hypothetical protein
MANTSYPILYEGSNGSSLDLLAARAPIDLECFSMTAQMELKKHADGAASGVHKFLQDTFTAGARSAKDMEEVEREVQRMLNKTVQEESSLDQFKAEFRRGATQVERSSAWTTGLPAQEKVPKQIEIRVAPEDSYKDRGDHLEMVLWVVLDVFLKRSGTENQITTLFTVHTPTPNTSNSVSSVRLPRLNRMLRPIRISQTIKPMT